MHIRYQAGLTRHLGLAEETLQPPPGVTTVAQLAIHLGQRGDTWRALLTPAGTEIRINGKDARWCDRLGQEDVVDLSLRPGQGD